MSGLAVDYMFFILFLSLKVISVQEKVHFRGNKKLSYDIWSSDYAAVLVGS